MTDHSTRDLREFLEFAESKGKSAWLQIDKSISPKFMTTAVVTGLARKLRSPVIRFNDIEGSDLPTVTNICASLDRVARSAGMTANDLNERLVGAMSAGIKPVVLDRDDTPAQQVVRDADAFSLHELPALYYTDTQDAPYLTSALVVGRDPDTGAHNLSFHRLMIADDHTCAIYMTPGGHLDQIWHKYSARGEPTPLAAVVGNHPLWCYGALIAGALEHEDYDVVSGLLDAPLALTRCLSHPELQVPALAEMIFEGVIEPAETLQEGPFGEFLGYVADKAARPVVRFTKLTHREQPIYQDIVAGQTEHATMSSVSLRARLNRDYMQDEPAIRDFWLPAPMTIFLSVEEYAEDFDAQAFMQRLLTKEAYLKQAIAFDADVDLRKQASVQMALACFTQPGRDVAIYTDQNGNGVDPSETDGRTSKIAIDARSRMHAVRNLLPESVETEFDLNDWIR
ncbi:MAG: UbiD family decarboxylase domain-containing protein [Pseudomonadota bacterium]